MGITHNTFRNHIVGLTEISALPWWKSRIPEMQIIAGSGYGLWVGLGKKMGYGVEWDVEVGGERLKAILCHAAHAVVILKS